MNFKTFTEEYGSYSGKITPRTIDLEPSKAILMLRSQYNEAWNQILENGPLLFRGLTDGPKICGYVDPKIRYKPSKETKNYYQFIMDSLPEWSAYPKRGNSIICSTSDHTAKFYGDVYVVIPANGAKFAIAPEDDVHECFPMIGDLAQWSTLMTHLFFILTGKNYNANTSLEEFNKTCNAFDQTYKIMGREKFIEKVVSTYPLYTGDSGWGKNGWYHWEIEAFKMQFMPIYTGDLWEYFKVVFDPQKNKFELAASYNEATKKVYKYSTETSRHEIWTDSQCIVLSMYYLLSFQNTKDATK